MKTNKGNCYEMAGKAVTSGDIPGLVLCHGFPICLNKDKHYGKRFGHAWCELNDSVLDFSSGSQVVISRKKYYELGQIDQAKIKRYTYEEAAELAVETGLWKDWRDQAELEDILFIPH